MLREMQKKCVKKMSLSTKKQFKVLNRDSAGVIMNLTMKKSVWGRQ